MSSSQTWRGDAVAISQADTFRITNNDTATTYSATINGKSVSLTGSGSDTATAADWQVALGASTIPEFLESSWSVDSSVTLTRTAAVPGTRCPLASEVSGGFTISVSGGAGTLSAVGTATPNSGPNDYKVAANWVSGSVPGNGDTINFTNSQASVWYGIDQSAVATVTINQDNTYVGQIGLPQFNSNGYYEYRPTYLKFAGLTANLGAALGQSGGSGRIKLDSAAAVMSATVYSAGAPSDQGQPAVILRNGTTANTLAVYQGQVGCAIGPGDTIGFTTINMGYLTNKQTDAQIVLGGGASLSTCSITQNGGTLQYASSIARLLMEAGTTNVLGSASVTTADIEGGTLNYQSTGTIGSITIGVAGTIDFSRALGTRAITNSTIYGTWNDPNAAATWTNAAFFPNGTGGQNGATLNLGSNYRLQRS